MESLHWQEKHRWKKGRDLADYVKSIRDTYGLQEEWVKEG